MRLRQRVWWWGEILRGRGVDRVALRVVGGRVGVPSWVPAWAVRVLGSDVDAGAGVAAVRVGWLAGWAWGREYDVLVERYGGRWQVLGGGSGPADPARGEVEVLEVRSGAGCLSRSRSEDPPRSAGAARWIACTVVRVGPEVTHLLVGERRLTVPPSGEVVAAWTSRQHFRGGTRPLVVALGRDGRELSRIGPDDVLDSHTWRRLADEL